MQYGMHHAELSAKTGTDGEFDEFILHQLYREWEMDDRVDDYYDASPLGVRRASAAWQQRGVDIRATASHWQNIERRDKASSVRVSFCFCGESVCCLGEALHTTCRSSSTVASGERRVENIPRGRTDFSKN